MASWTVNSALSAVCSLQSSDHSINNWVAIPRPLNPSPDFKATFYKWPWTKRLPMVICWAPFSVRFKRSSLHTLEILSLWLNWSEVWCLFVCLVEWRCIHIYCQLPHRWLVQSQLLCISAKMYGFNKHSSSQHRRDGLSLLPRNVLLYLRRFQTRMTWCWGLERSLGGSFTHMICADLNCTDMQWIRMTWLPQMASGWSDLMVQGLKVEPYSEKAGLPPLFYEPSLAVTQHHHHHTQWSREGSLHTGETDLSSPMERVSKNCNNF